MRVFLIVLDSLGIGAAPDAADYGDEGSNTLAAVCATGKLNVPNLTRLGLFDIEDVNVGKPSGAPAAVATRLRELSAGKDTTTGHWELAGLVSDKPFPTYPDGFPEELIRAFEEATGRGVLCNAPYSGTEVIKVFGREHEQSGKLIVYTSADSVFQIAAHEQIVPVELLYRYCEQARELLCGKHAVARVIARPFEGEYPDYTRTAGRHDFSLAPTADTVLNKLEAAGKDVLAVGKIKDIFAGSGVTESISTTDNAEGMKRLDEIAKTNFDGLCFANLVDFDMLFGHRNDADGYAEALNRFDEWLGGFIDRLKKEDVLIITADHGCDPSTASTDHSREYVPCLVYGNGAEGCSNGTKDGFGYVARTLEQLLLNCN